MTMITVKIDGLNATKARLEGMQKQIRYAASRALNSIAFSVNAEIKEEMKRSFKGGPTAFTLRAFRIERATRDNLTARVVLREDSSEGGTTYAKALRHLFSGGTRDWKKVEGALRGCGLVPDGYMIVPGKDCPLDSRGNIKRTQFAEMFGVLRSSIRNLRLDYTRARDRGMGRSKQIGFFVIMPGARSHLYPGIYRRIDQSSANATMLKSKRTQYKSGIQPYIMFVKPGRWRQFIDLQRLGEQVVSKRWQPEFERELTAALASAR